MITPMHYKLATFCLLMSCASAGPVVEVTLAGPQRAERGEDCEVTRYAFMPPWRPVQDVAVIRVRCDALDAVEATRAACEELLRQAACRAGADTLYGFRRAPVTQGLEMVAHAAVKQVLRPDFKDVPCAPACSAGHQCQAGRCTEVCEPDCDEGFVCEKQACVPLCNPPCLAGERCGEERRCLPVADASSVGGLEDGGVPAASASDDPRASEGDLASPTPATPPKR